MESFRQSSPPAAKKIMETPPKDVEASPPAAKKASAKGAWTASTRRALSRAEAKAAALLSAGDVTTASVESVLAGLEEWPTQARPNVSPNEKPVTGMCFGAVNVLGGVGMAVSAVSQNFPKTSALVARWAVASLPPGFPFSSLQINYNYAAKKHVDGNNIGPSYIVSLGEHAGGGLWVADTFVEKVAEDGGTVLRGGGGEATLDCHRKWTLFDGNAEHMTLPFSPVAGGTARATRISIVAFTHASYNKLPPAVASGLAALGFTAGSSDGVELDFFKTFRIDKSELDGAALEAYLALREARRSKRPPPSKVGAVGIECNGYTAGKGAGWFSFVASNATKRSRIDAFFKPRNAVTREAAGPLAYALPKKTNAASTNETSASIDAGNVVTISLPKNRVGLWFCDLDRAASGALKIAHLERFDLYNEPVDAQAAAFAAHVAAMPAGRVALVSITDTAMAKTRPLPPLVYDVLRDLGAPAAIEPIGYRMPFAMIGVKGAKPGAALLALDKTKIILRLEAVVAPDAALAEATIERFDITEHILEAAGAADAQNAAAAPAATPKA